MTQKGIRGVRAVTADALGRIERRRRAPDPMIGEARMLADASGKPQPVKPGEWMPGPDGMPPDCPVQILGMDGDVLYLIDAMGQLATCEPSQFGQNFVQRLFQGRHLYLYWAWPRFSKDGVIENWRTEKVRECFYGAAAHAGLFSQVDQVRGRGAWRHRKGGLIMHCGDVLYMSDRRGRAGELLPLDTGFHDGFLYPRRPSLDEPWSEPLAPHENPARDILEALRRWNWKRPEVDPVLMLGWIVLALLGGAPHWRPVVFLIGDKATGKSTLQAMLREILRSTLVQSADTTAAGIYQRMGQDSLPVAIDELEAEADTRKTMAVVKLARLAASGSQMSRGGQDHVGTQFRAWSCFLFSSINPPPLLPQDLSRMALLRLQPLDKARAHEPPPVMDGDACGRMLRRVILDNWSRYDAALAAYREVLAAGGHDGRGQDTLGVLLACADIALGPELAEELGVPMVDDIGRWSELLATSTMLEYEDNSANWRNCLRQLLTSPVEAWRGGKRHTVGQMLHDLMSGNVIDEGAAAGEEVDLNKANEYLAQAGLRVLPPGKVKGERWLLAVPNDSQLVARLFGRENLFAGVPGAGIWKEALRQAPAELILTDKAHNRVTINGFQERCTLVRIEVFNKGEW